VTVELPSLAYRRKGQQGALTPELLAQWIAEDNGGSVNTRLVEQTTWFIDCLRRANQESLPTPRHHNYYTDSFIPLAPPGTEVVFQHFLLGGGFWWLDGVFLLGVPIALIWFLRRRSAPDSGNFQDVSHQEPQDVGSA
jgi:hypothetical protein